MVATLPGQAWHPDVTVATVVALQGRLLLVEERIDGQLVLNQPAGHLEPGESLLQAAVRETREETGWDVELTAFIGAYQWRAETNRHYLRFAFAAEPVRELPDARLDEGIVRALWLTPEALRGMASRHRSPLVWRAVADYLGGSRHPLDLVRHLA